MEVCLDGFLRTIDDPGHNVGIGKDDTLYAKVAGYVKFERVGKDRKQASVYEEK